MGDELKILLELRSGRGTARSAVEGHAAVPNPSTMQRMVPLPQTSWGRI
jgi:hypothetical protein